MALRELSIRAKVAITVLGALLVVLGVATTFSLRYWEQEQFALTNDHAQMMAGAARSSVEGALAHGQAGYVREQLESMGGRTPFGGFRLVARDGKVLMSSTAAEEGKPRTGPPLPDP
jgi:hypothetical protein